MKDSDIKKLWNQDIAPDVQGIEKELIEKSIREGSINVIDRFVKTLKVELWINLISLTALTLILSYQAHWFSALFVLIINIVFLVYYRMLINKLSEKIIDNSVTNYLKAAYENIDKFVTHYKVASVVIVIPSVLLAMYVSNPEVFSYESLLTAKTIGLIAFAIFLALGLAFALIHFLYGKKAKEIKRLLEDLDRIED